MNSKLSGLIFCLSHFNEGSRQYTMARIKGNEQDCICIAVAIGKFPEVLQCEGRAFQMTIFLA